MPRVFLTSLDLKGNELQNFRVQSLASAPSSPVAGQLYYDSVAARLYVYNGSTWVMPASDADTLQGQNGAYYRARTNHTGTQAASTISDFDEAAQDAVGGALTDTATVDFTYNDAAGQISAAVLDSPTLQSQNGAYYLGRANHSGTQAASTISDFTEAAQDAVGGALVDTATLDFTYDDAANQISGAVLDSPLLGGQNSAYHRSRTNHSGTQTASTISDFDTQVRTSRLDQLAVPTTDVSFNTHKLINVTDPTGPQDAATKAYVDSTAQGLDIKLSVRVASTANIDLSAPGAAIDGITMSAGNRFLAKNQSTGSENGIYVWNGAAAAATRAADADTSAEVTPGLFTFVEEGTTNADSGWVLTTDAPITLGTTGLTFAQFSGAGQITAGAGLTRSGNTLNVGQGYGITVNPDDVAVDTSVLARKFNAVIGNGSATSFTVNHALGNQWAVVQVYQNASPFALVDTEVELTDSNNALVRFALAPTSNQYRVLVTA
jgi:hypothetical protein